MSSKQDQGNDPVVNEYDVYVTHNLIEKFCLLQFPSRKRDRPYNDEYGNKPLAFRMKPKNGFVEMDIPLNTEINYDKRKAAAWGSALSKSKSDGADGYGMAVGFAQQIPKGGRRPNATIAEDEDEDEDQQPLDRQTLGGQMIYNERGKPNYMVGTFLTDKRELHLTELDSIVQMRPQFHHIDARTQVERNKARREREAGEPSVAKSQIVQVSYASIDQQEQAEGASAKELLKAAHDEPWKHLRFHDEEADESYDSYTTHMFLAQDRQTTELVSTMNNEKYLDAISAPRLDHRGIPRTKPMTKKLKAQIELSDNESEPEKEEPETTVSGIAASSETH